MSSGKGAEMPGETTDHPSEETLELYVMARLPETDEARVEEHLLVCEECRDRVQEAEDYVQAMQTALAELENQPAERPFRRRGPFGLPRLAWAGSLAAAAALAVVLILPKGPGGAEPVQLKLTALRGETALTAPVAPEGRALKLRLDAEGLEAPAPYEVRVVDAGGRERFAAVAKPVNGALAFDLPGGLPAGRYWVRIFEPGRPEVPLREFGFRVE